ncbi:hypothetical protein [Methanooceanicella nereidis]|nr:hypothetical protein [Methanocella sp. CWC-04]
MGIFPEWSVKEYFSFIGRSIAAGLVCGILFIAAFFVIGSVWSFPVEYNWRFFLVRDIHLLMSEAGILMMGGIMSVSLTNTLFKKNRDITSSPVFKESLISAFIAGVTAALVIMPVFLVLLIILFNLGFLLNHPTNPNMSAYDRLGDTIMNTPLYGYGSLIAGIEFFFLSCLICVSLGAIAAYVYTHFLLRKESKVKYNAKKNDSSKVIFKIAAVLLILLAAPPASSTVGCVCGLAYSTPYGPYGLSIERIADDSISIICHGGECTGLLDDSMPFTIFVNGCNILDTALAPVDSPLSSAGIVNGSRYYIGSFLNLTGEDIKPGKYSSVDMDRAGSHIIVNANFKDGSRLLLFDDYV